MANPHHRRLQAVHTVNDTGPPSTYPVRPSMFYDCTYGSKSIAMEYVGGVTWNQIMDAMRTEIRFKMIGGIDLHGCSCHGVDVTYIGKVRFTVILCDENAPLYSEQWTALVYTTLDIGSTFRTLGTNLRQNAFRLSVTVIPITWTKLRKGMLSAHEADSRVKISKYPPSLTPEETSSRGMALNSATTLHVTIRDHHGQSAIVRYAPLLCGKSQAGGYIIQHYMYSTRM
ncbi:hypothetical protein EDD15DRAFT_339695 [Pisolithus albus]|nr:hypothetical protein EDD15DRAFT_339695 [Pisolithus albus]